jgi:ferredoxin
LKVEPGFGGPWPGDPNATRYNVTILREDTGQRFELQVPRDRYIYFVFEEEGVDLPIHNRQRMCRNGCCTTCAVKVREGSVKMESALGIAKELKEEGYALTCCSYPRSDLVLSLINEDEVYIRQWGSTFEGGGVEWGGLLPEED